MTNLAMTLHKNWTAICTNFGSRESAAIDYDDDDDDWLVDTLKGYLPGIPPMTPYNSCILVIIAYWLLVWASIMALVAAALLNTWKYNSSSRSSSRGTDYMS